MKATPDIFYRKIKSDKENLPPIFVSMKMKLSKLMIYYYVLFKLVLKKLQNTLQMRFIELGLFQEQVSNNRNYKLSLIR